MTGQLSKEAILTGLEEASKAFSDFSLSIENELFFLQPGNKWSVAQNVSHLAIAARSTRPAFYLPKFILRLYMGKPNRASRTYEELVKKYQLKLEQGGKASGKFIPKTVLPELSKEKLLSSFSRSMKRLASAIRRNWEDSQLDKYLAPHPLLGKITLRELCYFTIYHTWHHLRIIRERSAD